MLRSTHNRDTQTEHSEEHTNGSHLQVQQHELVTRALEVGPLQNGEQRTQHLPPAFFVE